MSGRTFYISAFRPLLLSPAVITALAVFLSVPSAMAQGLAQVTMSGIPPVLPSPLVSEIAVGFEQGRYPLSLVVTSPDRQPVEFTLRFVLEHEGQTVFELESDPVSFERGVYVYTSFDQDPAITFPVTYRELLSGSAGALGQDVSRTGLLSEGMYSLTVEALSTDPGRLVLTIPSVSTFFVQYLEPPILLAPTQDEVVRSSLPVFSWLPVIGAAAGSSFDYEFVLVEVYPGQEPQQAIESNRPIEIIDVPSVTTLPYTVDRLPLEPGTLYAWQVTAHDTEGLLPFTDGGRSEISTFLYSPANPSLATWTYPYSRPVVTFDLSDAELRPEGYHVHGLVEGQTGHAPVGAFFDNVLIDPVTFNVLEGSVEILGPMAENTGAIESGALRHVLSDDTGPSAPSVVVRQSAAGDKARLSITIGPSQDPESGISNVSLRLSPTAQAGSAEVFSQGGFGWQPVYSNVEPAPGPFDGASARIEVPAAALDALALGWLTVDVRVTNGLGLQTTVSEAVGAPSDISPPVLTIGSLAYAGYYDLETPNTVVLENLAAADDESGVARIQYRLSGDPVGSWNVIAEPATNRFFVPELPFVLPDVTQDTTVFVQVGAVNRAGLISVWTSSITIEIDRTPPVRVADIGVFVTSDTDPRIELSAASVRDQQSGIRNISYRVVDQAGSDNVYVDWTPFPESGAAQIKRTQLNFANRRSVRVEVRAQNRAGLSSSFRQIIVVPALAIADLSPPSSPAVTARITSPLNASGELVFDLRIGQSEDPESGISRVLYRVENAISGEALIAWRSVTGVESGVFRGGVERVQVQVSERVRSLRVVVNVTNGAGRSTTSGTTIALRTQDITPPEIRGIQAYSQGDRLLIFIDGLADPESLIDRVDYRVLGANGAVLVDWTVYPIVPSRRPSYGRQLLRVAVPPGAAGTQIVVQLRAYNGVGLSTSTEQTVTVER